MEKYTTYTIKVIYSYDLNDGQSERVMTTLEDITTKFFSGDGTILNPYKIYTVEDLQNINEMPEANFILMNNIDLTGVSWTPIRYENNEFSGSFNGNNPILTRRSYLLNMTLN
ncbi:hypothetical protein N7603_08790 [Acholeplasma vituli]|uniref:Uncharacterized protein n=1 Tax=Paracholeplasma vituli TaxID=69473 RepID=A0ABT2Q1B8_9MOLU|nr:hypothetical protein [Paracholeplasma vituli]MCU0105742.1 hypothetical protein [Paracholeplasma vituli]